MHLLVALLREIGTQGISLIKTAEGKRINVTGVYCIISEQEIIFSSMN